MRQLSFGEVNNAQSFGTNNAGCGVDDLGQTRLERRNCLTNLNAPDSIPSTRKAETTSCVKFPHNIIVDQQKMRQQPRIAQLPETHQLRSQRQPTRTQKFTKSKTWETLVAKQTKTISTAESCFQTIRKEIISI